jgi:uncharacterized damage-inducible protein DinB
VHRDVAYRTFKGEPFRHPLGVLLQHVYNHSTYHRGQVTMSLRILGAEPVGTDFVLYVREHAGRSPA